MQERLETYVGETYAGIETYLQEVSRHLGKLPPAVRDEEMKELRQHLLALVQAGEESGDTTDQAVQAALRQFGAPQAMGRELMRSRNCCDTKRLWRATAYGYATWYACILPAFAHLWITTGSLVQTFQIPSTWWLDPAFISFLAFYQVLVPFVAGWVTGMVAPQQAVRAAALLVFIQAAQLLVQQINVFNQIGPPNLINAIFLVATIVVPTTLVYLAAALLGALCGRRWKRQRDGNTWASASS